MSINPANTHIINKTVKNNKGEIVAYELENGDIIMKEEAVMMARQGEIKGVSTSVSKLGEEFLRSLPDGIENNNLESLPTINENDINL